MSVNDKIRDLFAAAINLAIYRGILSFENFSTSEFECILFGKRSLVRFEADELYSLEAYITVWWGVPDTIMNTRHVDLDKIDFHASVYFECEKGFWIQSNGCDGFHDKNCSQAAKRDLMKIPAIVPNGYEKSGRIIF